MSVVGKKLLILGATWSEMEIVDAARSMGVRTVVTDNHEDWDDAPAKGVADEAWDISWTDLDSLREACLESCVDGCIAGFSERRVAAAQSLCEEMGWPLFADGADLATIQDKIRFRRACVEAGVDVARSWEASDPRIEYPVIVKPADNGGSRGITVVRSADCLEEALREAEAASDAGRVLVEEYLSGDEFMAYYVVRDGVAELSAMCDRHMRSFDPSIAQVPVGYVFPSRHLASFRGRSDSSFRKLITSLGIRNGLIAFQAFATPDGRFVPFDPTFRLDGTVAYHFTDAVRGSSALRMLVRHSLTGSMDDPAAPAPPEDPVFERACLELPVLLGPGTIRTVVGLDEVGHDPRVVAIRRIREVGDSLERAADFSQMLCRILLVLDEGDCPSSVAREVLGRIRVMDSEGEDMVVFRAESADWRVRG